MTLSVGERKDFSVRPGGGWAPYPRANKNAKREGKSSSPAPITQLGRLARRTSDSILERVKSRAMQPCSTSNPLVIGGGIRPGEQCVIEFELKAYFDCCSPHIMEVGLFDPLIVGASF
jgi:hypothetical protein